VEKCQIAMSSESGFVSSFNFYLEDKNTVRTRRMQNPEPEYHSVFEVENLGRSRLERLIMSTKQARLS